MGHFSELLTSSESDVRHVLGLSGGKDSAALAIFIKDQYPEIHKKVEYLGGNARVPQEHNKESHLP